MSDKQLLIGGCCVIIAAALFVTCWIYGDTKESCTRSGYTVSHFTIEGVEVVGWCSKDSGGSTIIVNSTDLDRRYMRDLALKRKYGTDNQ